MSPCLVAFLCVQHYYPLQQGQAVFYLAYLLQLCAGHHYVFHVAMLQTEEEVVALLQFYGQGHVYGTGIEHGQFADDPQVAPFAEQGHGVAFLYSKCLKAGAKPVNLFVDIGICTRTEHAVALFKQECVLRVFLYR